MIFPQLKRYKEGYIIFLIFLKCLTSWLNFRNVLITTRWPLCLRISLNFLSTVIKDGNEQLMHVLDFLVIGETDSPSPMIVLHSR